MTKKRKNRKAFISLAIFTAIMIFYFSSIPSNNVPGPDFPLKATIYHISAFFFLSLFLFLAVDGVKQKEVFALIFIFCLVYAFLDELHQSFIPGRSSSLQDIFLDMVGISFSILISGIYGMKSFFR